MTTERAAQRGIIAPQPDPESAAWWDALRGGTFMLARCRACGHAWFPPAPGCPRCGSAGYDLTPASGRGRVYSWVVTHRAFSPAFANDLPYTVVAVDLAEGARVIARLLHGTPSPDAPVRAVIYDVEGQPLLGFEPA